MTAERVPRRLLIVEAGLALLEQRGGHGLTHRAIDKHLGLPLGSTGNYFPTRESLFHAVTEHLVELDLAALGPVPDGPVDSATAASLIGATIAQWSEPPMRHRQIARHELLVHSSRIPGLRRDLMRLRQGFVDLAAKALAAVGCEVPEQHALGLVALYDGLILDELFYAQDDLATRDTSRAKLVNDEIERFLTGCLSTPPRSDRA